MDPDAEFIHKKWFLGPWWQKIFTIRVPLSMQNFTLFLTGPRCYIMDTDGRKSGQLQTGTPMEALMLENGHWCQIFGKLLRKDPDGGTNARKQTLMLVLLIITHGPWCSKWDTNAKFLANYQKRTLMEAPMIKTDTNAIFTHYHSSTMMLKMGHRC